MSSTRRTVRCALVVLGAALPLAQLFIRVAPASGAQWLYGPSTTPSELAPGRIFENAATMPDGQHVVLYGGQLGQPPNGSPAAADSWIGDGASWTPICGTSHTAGCGPGPRVLQGMATGPGGVILYGGDNVITGTDGSGLVSNHDDTWKFDGTSWTQLCGSSIVMPCGPVGRTSMMMAGNGTDVIIFGGLKTNGGLAVLEDTWKLTGSTWTQICGISMGTPCGPAPRLGGSMAWDGSRFVLFGGTQDLGPTDTYLDGTWTFNPLSDTTWHHVCGEGLPTCGPHRRTWGTITSATAANPSNIVLMGGAVIGVPGVDSGPLYEVWQWTGSGWNQLPSLPTDPACGPAGAIFPTAATIGNHSVVIGDFGLLPNGHMSTFTAGFDLPGGLCALSPTTSTTTSAPVSSSTTTAVTPSAQTTKSVPILPRTGIYAARNSEIGGTMIVAGMACLLMAKDKRRGGHSAARKRAGAHSPHRGCAALRGCTGPRRH